MALVIRPGDEYRLRVTLGSKPSPELRLRITQDRGAYDLALLSSMPGITNRALGSFGSESQLWAGIAVLAVQWPSTGQPLPESNVYVLALLLAIVGGASTRTMDSHRFATEAELWAGLADYAAGRQADIAMSMLAAMEESEGRRGRVYR